MENNFIIDMEETLIDSVKVADAVLAKMLESDTYAAKICEVAKTKYAIDNPDATLVVKFNKEDGVVEIYKETPAFNEFINGISEPEDEDDYKDDYDEDDDYADDKDDEPTTDPELTAIFDAMQVTTNSMLTTANSMITIANSFTDLTNQLLKKLF